LDFPGFPFYAPREKNMSAIFGLFHLNNKPVARQDLDRMRAALTAYGPDGGGIWTEGAVGLGHCLMCFTPEDRFERQPLVHPTGKWVMVFDGRLDNRPELMRKCNIRSAEAVSLPDSVFVQRAFEKWGRDCLRHLIGSFTFALWTPRDNSMFIARSPIHGRPLLYHKTPRSFAFATMPKGLFALPHIPRELDEEVLADYLAWAPHEPDASFYCGIKRLQAGHSLVVQLGGLKVQKYWEMDLQREIFYPHDDDYVEAFNELFEQVVDAQLRSLTPVGVMMSGGLDSSSVAATAVSLLKPMGKRLAAFTEVPRAGFDGPIVPGRHADETPYVEAIAQFTNNLDLNLIRTDGQFYLDNVSRSFDAAEAPFRNASNRVYWEAILREAQAQAIGVLLTGGQGNLTISWPGNSLLANLIRQGRWIRAIREARALKEKGEASSTSRAFIGRGIMPLLPTSLWDVLERFRRGENRVLKSDPPWQIYSAINPDFAKENKVRERAQKMGFDFRFRPSPDTRTLRLKILPGLGILEGIGPGYNSMFGVDTRDPTVDVRIVEFCLSIPEEQCLRAGTSRWLIRRAMQDRLPSEVLWNKKRGLQAADWFERLYAAQGQVLHELERIERSDLGSRAIDLARLHHLVEQLPKPGSNGKELMQNYRMVLEIGLMTGRFIRWFEEER